MGARSLDGKDLLGWVATLVSFPIAGLVARAVAGPIDGAWAAFLGGVVAGAVIGLAQWLSLRRLGADARWVAATVVGVAGGLSLGYAILGYGDSVGELAMLGAVIGTVVGVAQWWVLRGVLEGSIWWIPASTVAWALGWAVTTAIGVDPDDRWANPGLSGAATLTLLLGGVLLLLGRGGVRSRSLT